MMKINVFFKVLHFILVLLTLLSGIIKVIGVRIEFMKITHLGFTDWKITVFGFVQIVVAMLLAFQKTMNVGAMAYSMLYAYVTWHYFAYGLQPIIVPILLIILPIALIFFKRHKFQTDK